MWIEYDPDMHCSWCGEEFDEEDDVYYNFENYSGSSKNKRVCQECVDDMLDDAKRRL